ncbi:MAG: T9SS type A sorting domain-containing protein, partial [Ignavibacteriaceae bacterium]|nr:T9SS type A sorting domain-containing protein [Ignavibacteriaceae bacterium]
TSQSGFNGINMWGVHTQPSDGNVVITGCYSCGNTWRTKNGGQTWYQIPIPSSNYQISIIDSMNQFSAQGAGFYKLQSQWFIPVELTSFTASVVNNNAELLWSTATELNNLGFDVERSFDNDNFEIIAFVPGFGTTTEPKNYSFTVENITPGIQYYRIKQVDFDGTETIYNSIEVDGPVPSEFALHQNHPNPFNPSTLISFSLPVDSDVKIKLYNMLGQTVAEIINKDFQAGTHELEFNADNLSSGAYIYYIEAEGINGKNFASTKKMILLK